MADAARETQVRRMLVEEFLAWPGDGATKRFQLFDGVPRAMSPASHVHGTIQANLTYLIKRRLIETASRCRVVTEPAIQPRARGRQNLRVPDLAVDCHRGEQGQIILPEPLLLVEILSPGNERDTRENVWAYTTIPSVAEILLVHSAAVAAELLRRLPDGSWPANPEEIGPGGTLRLESIDLTCALELPYEGTYLSGV